MIATWFAGMSTFAAVVTSLYIATRKPKPSITARISASIVADPNGGTRTGLSFDVSNIGNPPVEISSIHWHYKGSQKIVQLFDSTRSSPLPTRLEHGQSGFYFISMKNFNEWIRLFLGNIEKSGGKLSSLRLVVNLGTGKSFSFKPSKDLMKTFRSEKKLMRKEERNKKERN